MVYIFLKYRIMDKINFYGTFKRSNLRQGVSTFIGNNKERSFLMVHVYSHLINSSSSKIAER